MAGLALCHCLPAFTFLSPPPVWRTNLRAISSINKWTALCLFPIACSLLNREPHLSLLWMQGFTVYLQLAWPPRDPLPGFKGVYTTPSQNPKFLIVTLSIKSRIESISPLNSNLIYWWWFLYEILSAQLRFLCSHVAFEFRLNCT